MASKAKLPGFQGFSPFWGEEALLKDEVSEGPTKSPDMQTSTCGRVHAAEEEEEEEEEEEGE